MDLTLAWFLHQILTKPSSNHSPYLSQLSEPLKNKISHKCGPFHVTKIRTWVLGSSHYDFYRESAPNHNQITNHICGNMWPVFWVSLCRWSLINIMRIHKGLCWIATYSWFLWLWLHPWRQVCSLLEWCWNPTTSGGPNTPHPGYKCSSLCEKQLWNASFLNFHSDFSLHNKSLKFPTSNCASGNQEESCKSFTNRFNFV